MGQYYKTAIGDNIYVFLGVKLMEHSWMSCQGELYDLIKNTPKRVANIGDYTEFDETDSAQYADETAEAWTREKFELAWGSKSHIKEGVIGEKEFETYEEARANRQPAPSTGLLINHSKKEYLILSRYVKAATALHYLSETEETDEFSPRVISPLTLLTATSNDKGGGDYHSGNVFSDECGRWAGSIIEYRPEESFIPAGYTDLEIAFMEDRDLKGEMRELPQEYKEVILKYEYRK